MCTHDCELGGDIVLCVNILPFESNEKCDEMMCCERCFVKGDLTISMRTESIGSFHVLLLLLLLLLLLQHYKNISKVVYFHE